MSSSNFASRSRHDSMPIKASKSSSKLFIFSCLVESKYQSWALCAGVYMCVNGSKIRDERVNVNFQPSLSEKQVGLNIFALTSSSGSQAARKRHNPSLSSLIRVHRISCSGITQCFHRGRRYSNLPDLHPLSPSTYCSFQIYIRHHKRSSDFQQCSDATGRP
jgi:hypothetical protein